MTAADLEAEVARLRALVMQLAERLYIVAQHLGTLAERKEVRRR